MKRAVPAKRKLPPKKAPTFACHACYRPILTQGYCESCVASGGAARHLAMTHPATSTAPAGAGAAPIVSEAASRGGVPAAQPAPAPEPPATATRGAAQAPAPPPQRRRQTRAERRAPSPRETVLGKANRIAPGSGSVSKQSPARDAALRLRDSPGEIKVVHTYSSPERVKAALWYLRNRCDLPPGFTFYREGSSVVGWYNPDALPARHTNVRRSRM